MHGERSDSNPLSFYRSRASRLVGLIAVFLLLGLLLGVVSAEPVRAAGYNTEEAEFVRLLNDYRASNGLDRLLVSDKLSEAAKRHCSDMAKYHFFDHYTTGGSDWFPVGSSPWHRMAVCGYDYQTTKGENLAVGLRTAAEAFEGWKNSPSHNANMLSPDFKVIGVAYLHANGADFDCYWTTDFGRYVDETAHQLDTSPTTSIPSTPTNPVQPVAPQPPAPAPGQPAVPVPSKPAAPVPSQPLTPSRPSSGFSDVDSHTPYCVPIARLAELGVVHGFEDGSFRPTAPITRQQFAKMIALALDYDVRPVAAAGFNDVQAGTDAGDPLYPAGYIAACVAAGIVWGKPDGSFAPYDRVTRAQLITMVARAAGLSVTGPSDRLSVAAAPFADFSPDHYPWAAKAWGAGLLNGLTDMGADYAFWGNATRAEACALLCSLIELTTPSRR